MNRRPLEETEEIQEESDYVNAPVHTGNKKVAPSDQRCFTQSFPLIAVCWLILLVIMGLRIHFTAVISEKMSPENQQLETQNQQLETQNQQLETQNQQLETQRNDLTRQIQDMETNWNNLNVSRAQWSIDVYCPRKENGRQCKRCQDGWILTEPSCYVTHDGNTQAEWITWEEARADCRGKGSDLAVVHTDEEKRVISSYSWGSRGETSWGSRAETGYWIGLRVEDMKWKWIDGSDLNQTFWITAPTEGHCAVSLPRGGWKSVRCDERKRWICKKEALFV